MFNKSEIKKILFIKFGGIGDVLLSSAVLPNLRSYFPEAEINVLTYKNCRDVFDDNPFINRVLTFELERDASLRLIRSIRKQNYDLIIDLFANPRTAIVTYFSRAKYRVGYAFKHRKYAYNIPLVMDDVIGKMHNLDVNLEALKRIGIPVATRDLFLSITKYHDEFALKYFKDNNIENSFKIAIPMAGGWESKKYKVKDYIKLIKLFNEKYDVKFILTWGDEYEHRDSIQINKAVPGNTYVIPDTSIRYLAAFFKNSNAVLSGDSGHMHIAAVTGVPVLGIFGPTDPLQQGPVGAMHRTITHSQLVCLNCALLDCQIGNICMTELDKNKIIEAFLNMLEENNITIPLK